MTRKITELDTGYVRRQFATGDIPTQHQMPAYRELVKDLVDTPPSLAQIASGFHASVDFFAIKQLALLESRTDPVAIERSVARISVDNTRCYAFHLLLDGAIGDVQGLYRASYPHDARSGILAIDMGQPFRMRRPACHIFNILAPRAIVEAALPDADAIHGRFIQNGPLVRLVYDHLIATARELPTMTATAAEGALRTALRMILAAFGNEAKLSGDARAAVRAALFGRARRYIDTNLHQATLSPQTMLMALKLPRHTLYRLFEHEGGIETYIRNRRLRAAADELVRYPHVPVTDVAYGLGFRSPQDFSRAFRRSFDLTPQELRTRAQEMMPMVASTARRGRAFPERADRHLRDGP